MNEQEFRERLTKESWIDGTAVVTVGSACILFREAMEGKDKELADYKRHFCGAHQWSVEARPLEVEAAGDKCLVCTGAEARKAKDRRIAALELALRVKGAAADVDSTLVIASLEDLHAKAVRKCVDLRADLERVTKERDEASKSAAALSRACGAAEREASSLREELAQAKADVVEFNKIFGRQQAEVTERGGAIQRLCEQLAEAQREVERWKGHYESIQKRYAETGEAWNKNEAEVAALRAKLEAAEGALKAALGQLGHSPSCLSLNPTEQWAKQGSWSADRCHCVIAKVRAALTPSPTPEPTLTKEEPVRVGGVSYKCRICLGPAVDVCACICHKVPGPCPSRGPCFPPKGEPSTPEVERCKHREPTYPTDAACGRDMPCCLHGPDHPEEGR